MTSYSGKVESAGAQGHMLAARLDMLKLSPGTFAVFSHCFTCSNDTRAAAYISAALVAHGIVVLRFNFTGLGGSEGDFANTDFSSNVGNLVAAADWLRSDHSAPQLLVGHSLGGAAVLAATPRIAEARAVATVNAPAHPAHMLQHLVQAKSEILAQGETEVQLVGRPFGPKRQFIENIEGQKLAAIVARLGKALMMFQAQHDQSVAYLFTTARHPKSIVALDDADHLLIRKEDALYVGEVLAVWVHRHSIKRPGAMLCAGIAGVQSANFAEWRWRSPPESAVLKGRVRSHSPVV